jgi:hypothetical protein
LFFACPNCPSVPSNKINRLDAVFGTGYGTGGTKSLKCKINHKHTATHSKIRAKPCVKSPLKCGRRNFLFFRFVFRNFFCSHIRLPKTQNSCQQWRNLENWILSYRYK